MTRLAQVLVEAIILHYGRDELLRRLAHPFWFQSFGAVMGMDWHSSGITTSVVGALKRGLNPIAHELGLHVCGGRGRHSRKTPDELLSVAEVTGLDGAGLARTSRLVAKVDSAAVQDGFQLYLHSFVVTDDGAWVVIQQGMSIDNRQARRYHWQSEGLNDFVEEPHAAIEGPRQGTILNLTDHRADPSRRAQLEMVGVGPDGVINTLRRLGDEPTLPFAGDQEPELHLTMPAGHALQVNDVLLRRLHGNLAAAAECGPRDFAELLLVPGIGPRTVQALSLVSEVIHGAPCRFSDPARFSLAHGGKDGHPFPVPLDVFDHSLQVLRDAVAAAQLGNDDKLAAIRRLDEQSRRLERSSIGPGLGQIIEQERQRSSDLGGRSVFDGGTRTRQGGRQSQGKRPAKQKEDGNQLRLPGFDESGYR
jgi:hypothetical protein